MTSDSDIPSATTHQELTLDLNADVAEWCPLPGPPRRLLAVGTYQLNEATQQREGLLHIYNLLGQISRNSSSRISLHCAAKHVVPGIFDLGWLPFSERPILAAALADGSLRLLEVDNNNNNTNVVEVARVESPEQGGMALSVECRHPSTDSNDNALVSSYSDGTIALHKRLPSGELITEQSWRGHDLEAWTASFDAWNHNVIYSGGDDSAFKGWDRRISTTSTTTTTTTTNNNNNTATALWVDRNSHGAGVCSIASSPFQEHVVMTGSYDEKARLWDIRQGARPLAVAEVGVGGGVWRLKWHPTDSKLLLAACMHAGFVILRGDGAAGSVDVVETYAHQQTLGYGAGWCAEVGEDGTSVAATASFYDRLLHVWSPAAAAAVVSS